MDALKLLGVIFFLAFLVESLVEFFLGQTFDKVPALTPYKWALMYAAAAVGIVGAFVYKFDLLAIMGLYIGVTLQVTTLGMILTGLAIGRGSNFLHDILDKFFVAPSPKVTVTAQLDKHGEALVQREVIANLPTQPDESGRSNAESVANEAMRKQVDARLKEFDL